MKPHSLVALAIVLATVFLMIGASSDVDINMLRGCSDGEVAAWDATNSIWDCTGVSGSILVTGADGDSSTVQSDSGLELIGGLITMLRGCADNEILKWDETADDWNCEADATVALGNYMDLPEIAEPGSPAANELRLWVEDVHGFSVFSYKDDGGMVRKIVRDSVFVGYNNSGATIAAGRIVYASGASGDVPTIALAKADAAATMPAIGVTIESISDTSYGRIMQVGLLEDLNTSSYSIGDVLYVSDATAGIPTATPPSYPDIRQEIGTVLVSDASTGAIQIVARSAFDDTLIDHGALIGISDDDHTQYILHTALDAEAELEAQLTDVANVFTDNDVDVVDADALKDTDAPADEECLTYEATGTTFEWQTCVGAGANSFETHDVPSGTDPVADSSSDTLTWTVTGSEITLTGNATTDTIDIDFAANAGTDVTADLEEETHASEHAESAADELNLEDLDTDCTSDQFLRESSGGVICYTMVAAAITNAHAGTDITADLEEDAHCAEHDGRSTTCATEALSADAELYTDTKCIWFEDPTAADDFKSMWTANLACTITGISCESDQTVNFDLQIDDGTPADINGSDIACTSTWAEDTTLAGDTSMGANEHMDLAITSVSGTPTWVSICWEFTYDD